MRNVSDKSCRENQNTHFVFSNFFSFENHAVYEIVWKKYGRIRQATYDNMAPAHCMLVATNTHTEYEILIAFQRQQTLHERVSMLGLYVHYLSCLVLVYRLLTTLAPPKKGKIFLRL